MIFEKQVVNMYKRMMHARCDDNGDVFYFSAKDFDGLRSEPFTFASSMGHKLVGYLYSYDAPIAKRIVVFDHGFGGGHRAYMKEIEKLCSHGYLVLSYDHTGCMESGGDSPNGMSQSLRDLNDCINALKADSRFDGFDISVVGHSWGAFSTLNITALHPDVSRIVAISGFVSVERMVGSFFGGILKFYRKAIMELEKTANPDFVGYDATKSLKNTKSKALLIYSDNDTMCRKNPHFDALKEALSDSPNVRFLLVSGKGHNPNYTTDAVAYMAGFFSEKKRLMKKKKLSSESEKKAFLASYDWHRMTAQDDDVWDEIFRTLDA